jgi:hypothetical protein
MDERDQQTNQGQEPENPTGGDSGGTVINWTLLSWCLAVVVELLILAVLIPFPLIILLSVVLINPVRAALAWRERLPAPSSVPADRPTPSA